MGRPGDIEKSVGHVLCQHWVGGYRLIVNGYYVINVTALINSEEENDESSE